MAIIFEDRPSDSPFVERIWRSRCEVPGPFLSLALNRWQLVVWSARGRTYFTVRGPETHATLAESPEHDDYVGIVLKPGVYMPFLPVTSLVDRAVTLPEATSRSFWLNGSAWRYPGFEQADTFISRLAREGLLVREPSVGAILQGYPIYLSPRSIQRRVAQATGLTLGTMRQIERARYALDLLRQGASIADTVALAGYFDQPHLTRSLTRYIGQTPGQISGKSAGAQLSFLYKTSPLLEPHNGVA